MDAPADSATSAATPDDTALDDGFFILFSSLAGPHAFTAGHPTVGSATATVTVAADGVVRQDIHLGVAAYSYQN